MRLFQTSVQQLQNQVKLQKGTVSSINKEIQQITQRKEKIVKENGEAELEIKKCDHEVSKIKSETEECQARVSFFYLFI